MWEWLGWTDYRQEFYTLLGFARTCPTEAALADAVRCILAYADAAAPTLHSHGRCFPMVTTR